MSTAGIYQIVNIKTGKKYIGSATNIQKRKNQHVHKLRNKKHENSYLQNSWNKDGEENFLFETIEECETENLVEREQYWLDCYKSYERNNGFNIRKIADSNIGMKFNDVWIERLRESHKGQIITEEMKLKISLKERGRITSQETKEKISEALKNKKEYKNNKFAETKITEKEAMEIREKWKEKNITQVNLAKQYGVTQSTIWKIINFYSHKGER